MKSLWKNLEVICMVVVFASACISAMTWYGHGLHTWFWQVIAMGWVLNSYVYKKRLERASAK